MDAKAGMRIVAEALPYAFPLASLIVDGMTKSQEAVAEASDKDSLATEAKRQHIVMEYQAHTARVAQEFAIAQRMASADEVEIEEYYEGASKGTAGVKVDGEGATAGLSGEGRRVTKRIIRLKGTTLTTASDDAAFPPLE